MAKLYVPARLAVVAAGFAVVGVAFIIQSHAATFSVPAEAEAGQRGGAASLVNSAAASGGQAIQFGRQLPAQADISSVDNAVKNFMSRYAIPGVSIAVARQDKLVYAKSYGVNGGGDTSPTNNNSLYRLASVSKPITSVGIYSLIEAGKLSLNSTVFGPNGILGADYPNAPAVDNTITVQQLLTHTTGVWGNDANDPMFQHMEYSQKQLIAWTLSTYPADHNRGGFAYSNFGYIVLGRIIEKLSGSTYEQYIQQQVLAPMGVSDMQIGGNTLAARKPNEVIYTGQNGADPYAYNISVTRMDANGGWIASATDLARFLVHVDGFSGVPDTLKAATISAMVRPTAANPNYASGWSVNSENNWWHDGVLPGVAPEIIRAANGFDWVVVCNSRSNDSSFSNALDQLLWPYIKDSATPWQNVDRF